MNILFVCLGNICRSPTVEGVARQLAMREAPQLQLTFDSAGTADYHIGDAPDARSQRHALARGYDISGLRARQLTPPGHAARAQLFLSYFPEGSLRAVPDPYYGGPEGFEAVLDLAEHGSRGLLRALSDVSRGDRARPDRSSTRRG